MELLQHRFQFFRDRQSEMRGVLRKAHALVGDVEEDHRRAEYAARADDLHIEDVGDPHEQEDQYLLGDAFKADLTGQLFVRYSAHDARDVVHGHKHNECDKQTVTATEEVSEPTSDSCENELNNGIAQKAAFWLLMQARQSGKDSVKIPDSVSKWAMLMNVSRPSLHRELKKLEEEEIVSYSSGVVKLLDSDALQEVLSRS